jgi:AraC-like DNA-binding protein
MKQPSTATVSAAATLRPGKATVAAPFVTGMLAGLVRSGRDPRPLLEAAGIPMESLGDPATRVPVECYADLYNRVNRALGDEAFGLFSTPMRVGSFELLCRAVASAPNLGEALARLGRYLRVLLPDVAVGTLRHADAAVLRIEECRVLGLRADDPGRIFAFEWLLRLIHGLSCWLVGRPITLDRIDFPYPRPSHAGDYALIYTEHVGFGARTLEARFDATLLHLPIRRDETEIGRFLIGAPGKITTLYRRDRDTVLRVRELLRDSLPRNLDLDEVALALHLSPRTLHRRLADEGTNFRTVKNALRRDLALARLAKTNDAVGKIAAELGYADTSAFFRTFTVWTGMAPSEYRSGLATAQRSLSKAA